MEVKTGPIDRVIYLKFYLNVKWHYILFGISVVKFLICQVSKILKDNEKDKLLDTRIHKSLRNKEKEKDTGSMSMSWIHEYIIYTK